MSELKRPAPAYSKSLGASIGWFLSDSKRGLLDTYGEDFRKNNSKAIEIAEGFDRLKVVGPAVLPHLEEMCSPRLAHDTSAQARIFNELENAEYKAMDSAYRDIHRNLSKEGRSKVAKANRAPEIGSVSNENEQAMLRLKESVQQNLPDVEFVESSEGSEGSDVLMLTDYAALAEEFPSFVEEMMNSACETLPMLRRHTNSRA